MDWVWDTFETYRLNQADLQAYLAELYGSYDFAIEVVNGSYRFQIPELLTGDQRTELGNRRWEDD